MVKSKVIFEDEEQVEIKYPCFELKDIVETAKKIQKDTGAEYPFCKPDKGMLNGRLSGITTLPTTFLVDENGKIVGESYAGSKSLDEWKQVIEQELAKVQG